MDWHSGDDPHGSDATHWRHSVPRYQPLVTVVVALAAGVTLDRYGRPAAALSTVPVCLVALWLAAAVCGTAWWVVWRKRHDGPAAWLLLATIAASGAAWHDLRWNVFFRDEIARFTGAEAGPACVEAIALGRPDRLAKPWPTALRPIPVSERSRLDVRLAAIRDGTAWLPASGKCRLLVDGELNGVRAGDRLKVFAQLGRTLPPRNPGEFDFSQYDRAERRLTTLHAQSPDCVTVIRSENMLSLRRALDYLRAEGRQLIHRFIQPERAGLATAILLGARGAMPREETASYMLTGTVHVLVVSGLHVGILATGLYGLMRLGWLPRRIALSTIMVVVMLYTLVAGGEAPILRAAIVTVLVCIAIWNGRRSMGFNSLAAAAIVILMITPADLFRTGPQLSFLAVATLIWCGHARLLRRKRRRRDPLDELIAAAKPRYERATRRTFRWIGWLLVTATAVWLTALPLVLYQFHVVTPLAVLIAPAIWLLVLAALWSGFVMLACGWLIAPLGVVLGGICDLSLAGLERVVDWAGWLPGGHFWAPGPAWWWVLGFYLGVVAVMLWGRSLASQGWQLAVLTVWILVGVAPSLWRTATWNQLLVSFVAVGHGTCVVVETPGGKTLLYDAGSFSSPQSASQAIASYLWHRGIWHIDAIVLSHADVDHYNAVPGLVERFPVAAVYVPPPLRGVFSSSTNGGAVGELRAALVTARVPISEIWAGEPLPLGADTTCNVLHPPRLGAPGNDNASSIMLAIECEGRRVLLPGDLEPPGLDQILTRSPLDCDILMAPHHGSRRSHPPGLAAWSMPEWVVVSGGANPDVATVARTYEATGARVLHTHDDGTVVFSMRDGRPVLVWSYSGRVQSALPGQLSRQ